MGTVRAGEKRHGETHKQRRALGDRKRGQKKTQRLKRDLEP